MSDHRHHYVEGICAGFGAVPSPCGETQEFRPPKGQAVEFTDVLVDVEDIRTLLHYADFPEYDPHGYVSDLLKRLDKAGVIF